MYEINIAPPYVVELLLLNILLLIESIKDKFKKMLLPLDPYIAENIFEFISEIVLLIIEKAEPLLFYLD